MEFSQSKLKKSLAGIKLLLGGLALLMSTILLDRFVLPTTEVNDQIYSYASFSNKRNTTYGSSTYYKGNQFVTDKGFEFSTENTYISDPNITIKHTLLFKNVIGVYNSKKDYSKHLVSSVNSIMLYLYIMLDFSAICSLCYLHFAKNLTTNGFYNAILINAMIIFWILWLNFET